MKRANRLLSFILSVVMLGTVLVGANFSAYAQDYAQELRDKGFPESYVNDLLVLHRQHPTWIFETLDTKLDWESAVNAEYSNHKQLIENSVSEWYFCDCGECRTWNEGSQRYDYKIREGSNWVGASKNAVRYYLDPRNFLNEQYIFQFESNLYTGHETIDGVENIIGSTWMHNSNITFMDSNGNNQVFYLNGSTVKYSEAIMQAARDSGLSPYYIASKIVQEVGGKNPTAGGASGTVSGFEGIYNYYNIGANTGAIDGLRWASYQPSTDVPRTNVTCNIRTQPWVSHNPENSLGKVNAGADVKILSETGKQSDGYTWYQVETKLQNGNDVTGFIRSDLIDLPNKQDKYNRPWTNPYVSIVNGAKKIADGFSKYQYTGYLQKFNVNNVEGNRLHSHEYMANIRGAASEGNKIYKAIKDSQSMSNIRTFYIPVFKNMPEKMSNQVTNFRIVDIGSKSLDYTWDYLPNAVRYEFYIRNNTKGTNFNKFINENTTTVNLGNLTVGNNYTVRIKPILLDPSTGMEYYGETMIINNTTGSLTGGWKVIDGEKYYYDNKDLTYSNRWAFIDGNWHYFYANGVLAHDTEISDSSSICYLDSNGYMAINGWGNTSNGVRYYDANGYVVYNTMIRYDNKYYHIDEMGYLVRNRWMYDDKGWYYLDSNGQMLKNGITRDSHGTLYVDENGRITEAKGWLYINDYGWLYVIEDGYLLTNSTIRDSHGNVYLDNEGRMTSNRWALANGSWVYVGNDGYVLTNSLIKDSYDLCYVDENGISVTNRWVWPSNGWMYFDNYGHIVRNNFANDSCGTTYLDGNGFMAYNQWIMKDNNWFNLDENGYLRKNQLVRDYMGWCFVDENGVMVTNRWMYIDNNWRYFDAEGHMAVNQMVRDSVGQCFVDENGVMVANRWIYVNNGWSNFDSNGHMQTNAFVRDSHGVCYVGNDGKMVYDQWVTDGNGSHYIDKNGYLV